MNTPQPQFDFLEGYIRNVFEEGGYGDLSEETKNQFIPQFVAEAQRRLGLAVLPLLDETSASEFVALMENENMSQDQLQAFWQKSIPDFDGVVKKTLDDFAEEFKKIISNI
ncbi:MAG: hypothetical protein COU33_05135 [Candidatus Magasanikbacteria bacterium CG10_big_fil_rev_8_21_14_0_10_43_6]|uniref:Uncharacterized protein n=1 Tax=Candidatus Magasanikbacteria bacterium CG10_big_fil_rev_8_21_14_0_10_43_6 TaxID=1974650 RepID=A0A2M6VZU9_9BACT|nr:MAG: hypothetical protein COU33_05135 [Candidatus Magasanikbacteria bacterium CG10_big_fil_rev_8_21_14_0_10_43_6]